MCRRSVSSFVSPGPRVPMPPPSRESAAPLPERRGSMYLSCAISTCTLPARLCARWAKMSRISIVRSTTRTSVSFSRLRICVGVSSRSKMISSIALSSQKVRISCTMPLPTHVAVSGAGRFCVSVATGSAPPLFASSQSSSSELSASYSPVSSATSSARSGRILFSVYSINRFLSVSVSRAAWGAAVPYARTAAGPPPIRR